MVHSGQLSAARIPLGEVAEWSNAPDSKSGEPRKGSGGSNPSLSATSLAGRIWHLVQRLGTGSWIDRLGCYFCGLSALGDDAQAVIGEGTDAVGAALDKFHFSVEALGDAVVPGEAPHA